METRNATKEVVSNQDDIEISGGLNQKKTSKIKKHENIFITTYSNFEKTYSFRSNQDARSGALAEVPFFHGYHGYELIYPIFTFRSDENPSISLVIQDASHLTLKSSICIKPHYLFYDEKDKEFLTTDTWFETEVVYDVTCNGLEGKSRTLIHNTGILSPNSAIEIVGGAADPSASVGESVLSEVIKSDSPVLIETTLSNIKDKRVYPHKALRNSYTISTLLYPEKLAASLKELMASLGDSFSLQDLHGLLKDKKEHQLLISKIENFLNIKSEQQNISVNYLFLKAQLVAAKKELAAVKDASATQLNEVQLKLKKITTLNDELQQLKNKNDSEIQSLLTKVSSENSGYRELQEINNKLKEQCTINQITIKEYEKQSQHAKNMLDHRINDINQLKREQLIANTMHVSSLEELQKTRIELLETRDELKCIKNSTKNRINTLEKELRDEQEKLRKSNYDKATLIRALLINEKQGLVERDQTNSLAVSSSSDDLLSFKNIWFALDILNPDIYQLFLPQINNLEIAKAALCSQDYCSILKMLPRQKDLRGIEALLLRLSQASPSTLKTMNSILLYLISKDAYSEATFIKAFEHLSSNESLNNQFNELIGILNREKITDLTIITNTFCNLDFSFVMLSLMKEKALSLVASLPAKMSQTQNTSRLAELSENPQALSKLTHILPYLSANQLSSESNIRSLFSFNHSIDDCYSLLQFKESRTTAEQLQEYGKDYTQSVTNFCKQGIETLLKPNRNPPDVNSELKMLAAKEFQHRHKWARLIADALLCISGLGIIVVGLARLALHKNSIFLSNSPTNRQRTVEAVIANNFGYKPH